MDERQTASDGKTSPLWQKIVWFAAIWAASVLALGTVATLIRFAIKR